MSDDIQRDVGKWYRTRLDYTQALARRTAWVGQSLAAHQVGRALPSEDTQAALPPLLASAEAPAIEEPS